MGYEIPADHHSIGSSKSVHIADVIRLSVCPSQYKVECFCGTWRGQAANIDALREAFEGHKLAVALDSYPKTFM